MSLDVQAASYVDAAQQCLGLVSEVADLEPRVGSLEEVGATDEEGYLVVGPEGFEKLRAGRVKGGTTHPSAAVRAVVPISGWSGGQGPVCADAVDDVWPERMPDGDAGVFEGRTANHAEPFHHGLGRLVQNGGHRPDHG